MHVPCSRNHNTLQKKVTKTRHALDQTLRRHSGDKLQLGQRYNVGLDYTLQQQQGTRLDDGTTMSVIP